MLHLTRILSRIKNFEPDNYPAWLSPVVLLVLVSLIIRLALWQELPSEYGGFSAAPPDLYFTALGEHFWEYVFYEHTKPPLTYFFHAALVKTCGQSCISQNLTYLPALLLDSLAVGLVYATSVRLGFRRSITWLICLIWSIELIGFEFWRSGGHQDHIAIFFVALFAWSVVKSKYIPTRRNLFIASVAGGLLVAQSTVALVAVPVALLFALLGDTNWRVTLQRSAVLLSVPLIIGLGLSAKNFYNVGVFSTSSLGGQNMMQFSILVGGSNLTHALVIAEQNDFPLWWRWCYERSRDFHADPIGPLYGSCFLTDAGYNFEMVQREMVKFPDSQVSDAIRADQATLRDQPWLFSGQTWESNSRFVALYGKESARVWQDLVKTRPGKFIKASYDVHEIFFRHGKRHLQILADGFLPRNPIFSKIESGFSLLLFVASLLCYALILTILFQTVLKAYSIRRNQLSRRWTGQSFPPGLGWLALACAVTALLFSTTSCCENDRFFVQVTPYLIPIAVYFITQVISVSELALSGLRNKIGGPESP